MTSKDEAPMMLWLAGAGLVLLIIGVAAMSALGPLVFGWHLTWSELRTRRFQRVMRPDDLVAPHTRLGRARARIDTAVARARDEGRDAGLEPRDDGYYFADQGRGAELNQQLADIFVERMQLAYDLRMAVEDWAAAISRRNTARIGGMLFIIVVLILCAYEPIGASVLFFGGQPLTAGRLALSGLGVALALAAMSAFGHSAAHMLLAGFADRPPGSGFRSAGARS